MPLLPLIVLALIQGLTEFLPVSSTAHLVLAPLLFHFEDPGLSFDLALHVGTLLAVLIYLRADLFGMARALLRRHAADGARERRLVLALALATLPAVVAGFLLKDAVETVLRSPLLIAWTTLGFGLVLYAADRYLARARQLADMNFGAALLIGLAQVIAIVPGVSRSGITMTAARLQGFARPAAARFSFLLSIPTIGGACLLGLRDILRAPQSFEPLDAALGAAIAFVAALLSMGALMRWVERRSFLPFVLYRVALGLFLFGWIYF